MKFKKLLVYGVLIIFFLPLISLAEEAQNLPNFEPTLYSEYPELKNWLGEQKAYEYNEHINFPDPLVNNYKKPDVELWIKGLKELTNAESVNRSIHIWYKNNKPKYVGMGDFYTIGDDKIEKVVLWGSEKLFSTEVGVYKWIYYFENNLLKRMDFVRLGGGLSGIRTMEYWNDTNIVKTIYIFKTLEDLEKGQYRIKEIHNEQGEQIKREGEID